MEDLVCGLVGMKDRRTKPLVENGVNSPILHPYRSIICNNRSLGLQDLSSPASPLVHAAGNMPGMGVFPLKYHRYGWNFLSSYQTMIV